VRLAAVILAVLVGTVAAAPQVEIKAQTQVQLTRVRMISDDVVEVAGKLFDLRTGDGLGHQLVDIRLYGQPKRIVTAEDGTFRVTSDVQPGALPIAITFRGARLLDASQTLEVSVDPTKAQLELAFTKLGDESGGVKLVVHASSDDGPAAITVALTIAQAGDAWKPLRTIETDKPFVLSRKDTGGPGQFRVRATFDGDAVRQGGSAETTFELTAGTTTTMEIRSPQLAYEDDLIVTGKVLDEDGQPVGRAAIALTSGDKRLAQTASGEDGNYRFKVEAELFGDCAQRPCPFGVQVATDPQSPYLRPSRTQPAVITVAAPQPVPVSYTLAAFLATVLAAGGFLAARTKPWERLRKHVPPAEARTSSDAAPASGGLVLARPGMMSTLRRANDDSFSGVVRDTVRGRPVADAVVRLWLGDAERVAGTAADGAFFIEQLASGEWRAEVAAPGHVTERFAVTIPHRGELRGVRIDLVPVRERVFQLYRRAAEPVLPEPKLWGIWSPRQIVDHVRSKRPSPALAELTDFVEEVYFSPRVAAEMILPQASERVDRAIEERTRQGRGG
jgi:hypothetical protein